MTLWGKVFNDLQLYSKQIIIAAQERKTRTKKLFLSLFGGNCVHTIPLTKNKGKVEVLPAKQL